MFSVTNAGVYFVLFCFILFNFFLTQVLTHARARKQLMMYILCTNININCQQRLINYTSIFLNKYLIFTILTLINVCKFQLSPVYRVHVHLERILICLHLNLFI